MMARSHVVAGGAAWVLAAPWLHLPALHPAYLSLAVAGALLPDIDHPASWVGRRARPLSTVLASVLGHRGVTHSLVAVAALVALLSHAGFRRSIVAALCVGYLSHLAADMLTPRGLRLAWPLRRTWTLPVCRTGSPAETVIVTLLLGFTAWRVLSTGKLISLSLAARGWAG
jgi:inner membrane protein